MSTRTVTLDFTGLVVPDGLTLTALVDPSGDPVPGLSLPMAWTDNGDDTFSFTFTLTGAASYRYTAFATVGGVDGPAFTGTVAGAGTVAAPSPFVLPTATYRSLDLQGRDTYATADGRGIRVNKLAGETNWPTTLASVSWYAQPTRDTVLYQADAASIGPIACSVTTPTGSGQAFTLELTDEVLSALTPGTGGYTYWFRANEETRPATLRSGVLTVRAGPEGL